MKNLTNYEPNYDLDQQAWRATVQTALNKSDQIILQATSEETNQEIDLKMYQETNREITGVITGKISQMTYAIVAESVRQANYDAIRVATAEST